MLEKVAFRLMSKYLIGWKKKADKDDVVVDVYGVLPELVASSFTRAEQKSYYLDLYKKLISLDKDPRLAKLSPQSEVYKKQLESLRGQFFKNERFLYNGEKLKFSGTDLFNESGLMKIGVYYDLVRYAFAEMLSDKDRSVAKEKAKTFMVADAKNEIVRDVADMAARANTFDEAWKKEIIELESGDFKINDETDAGEIEAKVSTLLAYLLDISLLLGAMAEYGSEARRVLSDVLSMLIISASNQDNKDYSANVIRNLQSSYGLDQTETDLIKNYCKLAYGKSENEAVQIASKLISELQSKGKVLGKFLKDSGEKYAPLKIRRDARGVILKLISSKTLFSDQVKNEKVMTDLKNEFESSLKGLLENFVDNIEGAIDLDIDDNLIDIKLTRNLRDIINRNLELNEGRANKFLEREQEGSEILDKSRERKEELTGKELFEQMKAKKDEEFKAGLQKKEEILLNFAKDLTLNKLVRAATDPNFQFVLQMPVFLIKNKNKIVDLATQLAGQSAKYKDKKDLVKSELNKILSGLTSNEVQDNSSVPANDVEALTELKGKAKDAQIGAKISKIIAAIAADVSKTKKGF